MNKAQNPNFLGINQLYQRSNDYQNGVHFTDWIHELKQEYSALNQNPNTRPSMDFVTWANKKEQNKKRNINNQLNSDAMSFENAKGKPAKAAPAKADTTKVKDGRGKDLLFKALNTGVDIAAAKMANKGGGSNPSPTSDEPLDTNTIFGMKPVVAYSLGGAVLIGIGVGIYFLVKKLKK